MKFTLVAVATVLTSVSQLTVGFSPRTQPRISKTPTNTQLASAVAPPQREAPGAGYVPEWEDRPGLSPEEFMESDMSKPDLSGMWECPLTRWDSDK